jgi:hypothetical protein
MRNFLLGVLITVVIVLVFRQCTYKQDITVGESSELIEKQLNQVSKLVVTEGHFTEVFNYQDSKAIFGEYYKANKKALVVVNAKVDVRYDLSELKYQVNEDEKTIEILAIPDEKISISPELEYYDIQADYFNPFEAEDYNAIAKAVKAKIKAKIERSSLKSNAKNRLISELAKFYILTESFGWTLKYQSQPVSSEGDLSDMVLKSRF